MSNTQLLNIVWTLLTGQNNNFGKWHGSPKHTSFPLWLYKSTAAFFSASSGMKDEDILSFPLFSLHSRLPSCAQGIRCPLLTPNNTFKTRNVKRTDNRTEMCEPTIKKHSLG